MLGSFLELSVWTRDIAASVAFYQALGFELARVNETWSHRYGVLTDGRLYIGLHEYEFDSPSVTFLRPGVAAAVAELRARGIEPDFAKTGAEEFNEAGFRDPAGQTVTLLEARTFSPVWRETPVGSACGHFTEYRYPAMDPAAVIRFWERLGAVVHRDEASPAVILAGMNLAPHPDADRPELVFQTSDPDAAAGELDRRGLSARRGARSSLVLRSPEGLGLRILPED